MLALVYDVEADREPLGRTMAVDVAVGAVEEHPAFGKPAAPDEIQRHRFAEAAVDALGVIVVIVADIARSPIAGGQEVGIMVVRQAVVEGRGAAGGIRSEGGSGGKKGG